MMIDLEKKNLLSIVIHGRNDNYNPHFLSRLEYSLEYASYCLENLNIKNFLRFTISDWGSEIPLRDALNLTKKCSEIIDFVEVDSKVAKLYGDPLSNFYNCGLAYNVGIKRSESIFVGKSAHDYIMSENFLINLYNFLKGNIYKLSEKENSFFVVPRKNLPEDLFQKTPSFEYLNSWLLKAGEIEADRSVKHGGAGGLYITSKENWEKLGGIDERYTRWGVMEYDLFMRANYYGIWYDTSRFGVWQYKIPRGDAKLRNKALSNRNVNKKWFSIDRNPNGLNWGLKKIAIKKLKKDKFNSKFIIPKNLVQKKYKKIINLLTLSKSLFWLPVSLRFLKISLEEINLTYLLLNLFKFNSIRSFAFVGFCKNFVPGNLSLFNTSTEIHVLDDLDRENKHKIIIDNDPHQDLIYGDKIYNRTIQLAELLMSMKHQGYYRPINGDVMKNIKSFILALPKEDYSNIIIIKNNIVKDRDLLSLTNEICTIRDSILCLVCTNLIFDKISDLRVIKESFEIFYFNKNIILLNKNSEKKINMNQIANNNIFKSLYFYTVINFLYYFIYFLRMIKMRVIYKLLKISV